ncbi:protein kinase [Nonomuraea sp. MCN248]|uniref:Protein kinase n=1 Tax=Nonomuraea corallina TaxID=2989783 RepID=A0ABT4S9W2_9ACTN|nr:protein kinase [Nonomuraea corallina]MDA0633954.1 protein kinase [Nonomuraea corallina]
MDTDDHDARADDEPVTRGAPVSPRPASTSGVRGGVSDDEPNGLFVGPPEAPDRHELLGEGIAGGEGITWKARYQGELTSPLPLAIKLLSPPRDAGPGWPSAREQQRWRDHAVLLRHLKLDHVVRLDEVFLGAPPHPPGSVREGTGASPQTMAYLVMEWVEGPTLHALLAGDPARADTIRRRLAYVAQAGEALASLASVTRSGGNPSLHRDVKPTNCIVHPKRGLVLIDVSTMRLIDDGYDLAGWHTPAYTSPEVLAAPHLPRAVAADVYALGALAYFCLTGQDPPAPDAPGAPAHIEAEVAAVARACGVGDPGRLTSHILAALDGDPSRRPTDLRNWSRGLLEAGGGEPATGHSPSSARPPRRLLYVIVAASLAVAGGGAFAPGLLERVSGGGDQSRTAPPSVTRSAGATSKDPTPSHATGDAVKPVGTIDAPADGAKVKYCSYFSGTASLPPGATLILAKQNMVNGDPQKYVELVFNYEKTSTLTSWRGAQYFGGENEGGVGQVYRIELVAVSLERARHFHDVEMSIEEIQELVRSGTSLADVQVRRVASGKPNECPGPPPD